MQSGQYRRKKSYNRSIFLTELMSIWLRETISLAPKIQTSWTEDCTHQKLDHRFYFGTMFINSGTTKFNRFMKCTCCISVFRSFKNRSYSLLSTNINSCVYLHTKKSINFLDRYPTDIVFVNMSRKNLSSKGTWSNDRLNAVE